MFKKDIDKIFTEIVADYISKNWIIYSSSIGENQGEKAKIDLVKDNEIVRILLDKNYNYESYSYTISVGIKKESSNLYRGKDFDKIFWNKDFEIIEEYKFYCIDKEKSYFTDNFYFYQDCMNIRYRRLKNTSCCESPKLYTNKSAWLIGYRLCKQTKGYKTVKLKDIVGILKYSNNQYGVKINGKENNPIFSFLK